jgi:hypothetical protein
MICCCIAAQNWCKATNEMLGRLVMPVLARVDGAAK